MNKKEDYAWNQYEQERHQQGLEPIPAPYKIKIKDDTSLRIQLEELLVQLPQAYLAEWALAIAQHFLPLMDPQLRNDPRIDRASEVFARRLSGRATAYEVRQAGFLANQLAKESKTEVSRFAARVFAQSIATGHMRGHAVVASDYGIKVVNLCYPNEKPEVIKERQRQIRQARQILQVYLKAQTK
ncbi:putative immunity protein [Enterococcus devriesei]|uniref:putative immunity protein n=1 Tax=Enterococcus devriesei TaxID=319970 RepID=UPI0028AB7195|nr:hypothetical protein [Enterococcus devriesei]